MISSLQTTKTDTGCQHSGMCTTQLPVGFEEASELVSLASTRKISMMHDDATDMVERYGSQAHIHAKIQRCSCMTTYALICRSWCSCDCYHEEVCSVQARGRMLLLWMGGDGRAPGHVQAIPHKIMSICSDAWRLCNIYTSSNQRCPDFIPQVFSPCVHRT